MEHTELMELIAPIIKAYSEDGHRLQVLGTESPIIVCSDAFRGSFILALGNCLRSAGKAFAIGATGANEPFIQL